MSVIYNCSWLVPKMHRLARTSMGTTQTTQVYMIFSWAPSQYKDGHSWFINSHHKGVAVVRPSYLNNWIFHSSYGENGSSVVSEHDVFKTDGENYWNGDSQCWVWNFIASISPYKPLCWDHMDAVTAQIVDTRLFIDKFVRINTKIKFHIMGSLLAGLVVWAHKAATILKSKCHNNIMTIPHAEFQINS